MITTATLKQIAPNCKNPELHAAGLETARRLSTVTTPRRLAHFIGQVFVETAGFTRLSENLKYTSPERLDAVFKSVNGVDDARVLIRLGEQAIANRVYANRLGNGDEASGDGWRYRGSGYKQLTGLYNYTVIGEIVGLDLVGNPDQAREPAMAARIAFAFWDAHACSSLADAGDIEAITEAVNGPAKLGLAERRAATKTALKIWGAS